jgi:AraC-like DNA-binding protein
MDAFAAVLRSLRLQSAIISRASLGGRWGVGTLGIPGAMIFHGVLAGRCLVSRDAEPDAMRELRPGDIVVMTRGDSHRLVSERGAPIVPITSLPMHTAHGVPFLEWGSGDARTRILCGTFALDHPAASTVVDLLPPILLAAADTAARRKWIDATLALLEEELAREGATANVTSLADSILVHVLTTSASAREAPQPGLIAAVSDEQLAPALAYIHAQPSRAGNVAKIAARVGMSRTRFFERFTELVGEPPARYITRWRVHAAADLLRRKTLSTQEVAEKVGYSSEDALTRVFRRYLGVSPSAYRRDRAAAGA